MTRPVLLLLIASCLPCALSAEAEGYARMDYNMEERVPPGWGEPDENRVDPDELPTDPAALIALVRQKRQEWQAAGAQYRARSDELLDAYRRAPHRPARWRAETWAQAINHWQLADWIQLSFFKDEEQQHLWEQVDELERVHAAGGDTAQLVEAVQWSLGATWFRFEHGCWFELATDTAVSITTAPAGLTWTIETTYGVLDGFTAADEKPKHLVVSGRTPIDETLFVGYGPATLRIKCPGQPDFVAELSSVGTAPATYEWLVANVDFNK